MTGRIVYPLRSRIGSNPLSRLLNGSSKEESVCDVCRKRNEFIDYLNGRRFFSCNDPGR